MGATDLRESFATYHSEYSIANNILHFERHLVTLAREVTPDQFENYRKFQKAIVDDEETFIPVFGGPLASAATSGSPEAQDLSQQGERALTQRDLPTALDAFQKSVDKDPNFAWGWISLAKTHVMMGDIDRATGELQKAMALDPTQVAVYKSFALALRTTNHDQIALEVWKNLEKTQPNDPDPPQNIAGILLARKRYAEVIAELELAVDRNPNAANLILLLGEAYVLDGQHDKGATALVKAASIDRSPEILNTAAYTLSDSNIHLEAALSYAQDATKQLETATSRVSLTNLTLHDIQNVPTLSAYWDTLGWVHFRMGHFDLAADYLNAAWNLTQDPVVADHLGQVYEKLGDKPKAVTAYTHSLEAGNSAPQDVRSRLDGARPPGKYRPGEGFDPAALQDLRTFKIHNGQKENQHQSAEFFVLFAPENRVVDVSFVSGDEKLQDSGKLLSGAKFDVPFPSGTSAQILRRGILDCEPELPDCVFVLIPPGSVKSVK